MKYTTTQETIKLSISVLMNDDYMILLKHPHFVGVFQGGETMIVKQLEETEVMQLGKMHYKAWYQTYFETMCEGFINYKSDSSMIDDAYNKVGTTFIALNDGQVVGFLYYRVHEVDIEIHELYVDYAYHKKNIATKLLMHLFLDNRMNQHFWLYVLKNNQSARSFYEHIGFTLTTDQKQLVVDETHTYTELKYVIDNPYITSLV